MTMKNYSIALMIYGGSNSSRNALTEEKYSKLATSFKENGFNVDSVIFNDAISAILAKELLKYDAVLVWVNPIEQGNDRKILDALLIELSANGCFVSAHPDTILKMGTKEILFKTKEMEFGGDIKLYTSFEDFKESFLPSAVSAGKRILKQYRGNGGNGVFKIDVANIKNDSIAVTHATGEDEKIFSVAGFFSAFSPYFKNNGILIDQEWNQNIINGMVRCYLSGYKVAGFGYQEVNALYPEKGKLPGKRYYFSEDCGLFRDLKEIMENNWVPELQKVISIENEMLPVIWDADFFINKVNTENTSKKYSLCEINVSCVSPFPESAVPFIIEETRKRIEAKK